MKAITTSITGLALVALLAGCGNSQQPGADPGSSVATQSATSPATARESTSSPTASPTGSELAESPASDGPSTSAPEASGAGSVPADPGSSPGAPVLGPDKKGQELGLADFFNPSASWTENRYDVANESGVSGIASDISTCGLKDYNDSGKLEMRLGNNFKQMSFKVGQANTSEASDQTLVVRVAGNNKQIDIWRIPFNETQEFSFPVTDVNALTVQFYLDDEVQRCGNSGSVQAVMYDIELQ